VLIAPLRAAGRLEILDGDAGLSPGVRAVATPGHTPGHQSVLVADELLVTGDLLVHAVQLLRPGLAYGHDVDAQTARVSRLVQLTPGRRLAVSHLGEAFTRA